MNCGDMSARDFGLWSVFVPPSSLGPVGFRINRGLYRGGALVAVTGYPRNGAPGPGEAIKPLAGLPEIKEKSGVENLVPVG